MRNRLSLLLNFKYKTETELSQATGISVDTLKRYASNPDIKIPQHFMKPIAEYFKVDVRFVCGLRFRVEGNIPSDIWEDIAGTPEFRDCILYEYCRLDRHCNLIFLNIPQPHEGTGFIAMSFDFNNPELVGIRDTIKKAVSDNGYDPDIMSESQRNGFIIPHMLDAIERCRFLVLDATYENCSAYLEAGYAIAIGKELFVCCKRSVYETCGVPFDIAQWNLVLWDDFEELETSLTHRIQENCYL